MFFIDEPSYLCIPFERLGISEDRVVVSMTSSCDCVRPSLVQYRAGDKQSKSAIQISVIADSIHERVDTTQVSLGVPIGIRFDDGSDQEIVVRFHLAEALRCL
jgi:hypothetical protein